MKVYPRACGGTDVLRFQVRYEVGLSPRVRGNHLQAHIDNHPSGSIPARAGEP